VSSSPSIQAPDLHVDRGIRRRRRSFLIDAIGEEMPGEKGEEMNMIQGGKEDGESMKSAGREG